MNEKISENLLCEFFTNLHLFCSFYATHREQNLRRAVEQSLNRERRANELVKKGVLGYGENLDHFIQPDEQITAGKQRQTDCQQLVPLKMQEGKNDAHEKVYIVNKRDDKQQFCAVP